MKPTVIYIPSPHDHIVLGDGAFLPFGTVHHPNISNSGCAVRTSTVVSVGDHGKFETNNTHYEPQ